MRTRGVWMGVLLVGLCLGWGSAARAAIWPLSLFTKPAPVKKHKPKHGKPGTGPVNMPGTVVSK